AAPDRRRGRQRAKWPLGIWRSTTGVFGERSSIHLFVTTPGLEASPRGLQILKFWDHLPTVFTTSVTSTSLERTRTLGCLASGAAEADSFKPLISPAAKLGGRITLKLKSAAAAFTVTASARAPGGRPVSVTCTSPF